jgi:anti-sigma B factor antagonist
MIDRMHEISRRPGSCVLFLRGEVDAHDAPDLRLSLSELVNGGTSDDRLVVDLVEVSFLDSTVLGVLVGAVRRAREAGGELQVVLPSGPARRIFEVTGVDAALDVYPSLEAALGG